MMNSRPQIVIGSLIGLVLLALAGWFLFWFVGAFSISDRSVQVSVIAAAVSIFGILFTFWKERTRSIREAHRDKKIEVYSNFFDVVFDLLKSKKEGIEIDLESDNTFRDRWFLLNKGAIFYGSPDVINALANFKGNAENSNPVNTMKKIGDIYLAMRKDIGLSNYGLDNIGIHQIYVSDDVRSILVKKDKL